MRNESIYEESRKERSNRYSRDYYREKFISLSKFYESTIERGIKPREGEKKKRKETLKIICTWIGSISFWNNFTLSSWKIHSFLRESMIDQG